MKLRFHPSSGFGHKLWQYQNDDLTPFSRVWIRFLKILVITVRDPFNKQLFNHAAALSYKLMLSLIPLLAMVFAVAKGFGVQDRIESILLEKAVGGEIANDLIPKIIEYVNNTNVKALGYIGLAFILYTTISMIGQIEDSFNEIWQVERSRTLVRKFSDYLSLLILGPLLLAITLGLSTTLSSHAFTQKLLEIGLFAGAMKLFLLSLPWLSSIVVIFLVYIIIPNTNVKMSTALFAGLVSGIAWQSTQIGFIAFQVGVANYNAIYGTFASVPIFMIWIFISWVIVLYGALLNFACQHVDDFQPIDFKEELNFGAQEKISLAVLIEVCREFEKDGSKSIALDIGRKIKLPVSLVESSLRHLAQMGSVVPVEEKNVHAYVPAKPLEQIKIEDFFRDIKSCDGQNFDIGDTAHALPVNKILEDYTDAINSKFSSADLLCRCRNLTTSENSSTTPAEEAEPNAESETQ
jgi:membrane protein